MANSTQPAEPGPPPPGSSPPGSFPPGSFPPGQPPAYPPPLAAYPPPPGYPAVYPPPAGPDFSPAGCPGWYAYAAPLRAPGTVTAAAVLAYIAAGLLLLPGLLGLFGIAALTGFFPDHPLMLMVVAFLVVGVVVGALYIAAGVQLQKGHSRAFIITVAAVHFGLLLLDRSTAYLSHASPASAIGTVFGLALPISILVLALMPPTAAWVQSHRLSRQ